jgi:hypothetical protein
MPAAAAGPVITELMADNQETLRDEDGEASDWIEVYNPGPAAANLDGWSLTDTPANPRLWRFPAVGLDAGAHLLVFASGKNRAPVGGELHANFRLSSSGEYLALVRPDGSAAAEFAPSFPPQRTDVSFGFGREVLGNPYVSAGHPAAILVPLNGSLGTTWTGSPTQEPFDDSAQAGWIQGAVGIGFPAGAGGAPPPQPMGYWSFDRSAQDASGNGHHAVIQGAVFSDEPAARLGSGQSLSFDGIDDYASVEIDVSETNYTLSLWFKADGASRGLFAVVDGDLGGNGHDRHLYLNGSNIASRVWNNETITSTARNYADRRWHHAAHVVSSQVGGQRIYVDGQLVASGSKAASDFNWQQRINIGFSNDAPNPYFDGLIDDVAVWDVALTLTQVQALAAGAHPLALAGFAPWVSTNLAPAMEGVNASAYVRIPFLVTLPLDFDALDLRIRYDDGLAAYLNGTEVARRNAPASLTYNSQALADRSVSQAVQLETIALEAHVGLLRNGRNVLAFHGLNSSAASTDFLVAPELLKVRTSAGRYLSPPTPGAANVLGVFDFVADLSFSVERGFYSSPQTVAISTPTAGAAIYTTIDGSEPSPTSPTSRLYTGPVGVSRTLALRARAFKPDFEPSVLVTHTYIFLDDVARQPALPPGLPSTWLNGAPADYAVDPDVVNATLPGYSFREALLAIPTLSVTTSNDDLFGATRGIYYNPYGRGLAWERPASLELIHPDGSPGFQANAGIRMHGNSSRDHGFTPKHPIRVNFRREYGLGRLRYSVFEDSEVDSFDNLLLRGASTDSWPVVDGNFVLGVQRWAAVHATYIRDQVMRDAQLAMGQPSGHGTYVHLYLNGLYWGLYNLAQRPGDSFNASHFGGDEDEYDVIKDFAELESGSLEAWNAMIALASAGLGSEAAYQRIQGRNPDGTRNPAFPVYLDVDNLIDYMILHIYAGAEDWPHHNWWGARRRGPESQGFKFFAWDQEISNDSLVRTHTLFQTRFEDPVDSPSPSYLYGRLLANPSFRRKFIDRVHRHLFNDGVLTEAASFARWEARVEEIDQAIVGESARWGDTRRATPYKREVEWMRELDFMSNQYWPGIHAIAIARFRRVGLYPSVEAPSFRIAGRPQHGGPISAGEELTITVPTEAGLTERPLVAADNPASAFVPSSDVLQGRWRLLDYVEGSSGETWRSGANGVGYENGSGYEGVIRIDVGAEMSGPAGNNSVYIRLPFTITSQAAIDAFEGLVLKMAFDDGFVAYLNGVEVATANAPAPAQLAWNSAATTGGEANLASPVAFDISAFRGELRPGRNLLAVHGLNFNNSSSDMLILAELAGLVVEEGVPTGTVYYTTDGSDPMQPGAPLYSGPVALSGTTLVKARATGGSEWSALTEALFVDADALPLRISEVMYHSPEEPVAGGYSAEDYDFIELVNAGPAPLALSGLRLDGGVEFDFTVGPFPSLDPGERVLVVEDLLAFATRYAIAGMMIAGEYTGSLSNAGEPLVLRGPSGEKLLDFAYDDAWYPETDGAGRSLVITDVSLPPQSWKLRESWRPSGVDGGSPGVSEGEDPSGGGWRRPGDSNQDGVLDISDAVSLLARLFGASLPLPCEGPSLSSGGNQSLLDGNNDGAVDVSDAVHVLSHLFRRGAPPALGTRCLRIEGCADDCAP